MDNIQKKRKIDNFLFIIAVAFIVHMIPVFFITGDFVDLYDQQAIPILKGENIYATTSRIFPYSPVSMFIPPLCALISMALKVSFPIIIRIPAALANIFTSGAIFLVLSRINSKNAFRRGMLYALAPAAILIGSFHGNIITIPTLFMFLSYVVLLYGVEENWRLSALLLGLAIGLRGFPVLLLPLFLIKLNLPMRKRLGYLAYATIPTALSFVPFLLLDYKAVFNEVFSYSGWTDFGFAAILRAIYSIKHNILAYGLPDGFHDVLLGATRKIFLAAYLLIIFLSRKMKLIDLILVVFLAFYFLYSGISAQYFIWILPFAFLAGGRALKFYVGICTMALIGFYYTYHPYILFGKFEAVKLPLKALLYNEVLWMGLLWIFCGIWMARLMVMERKDEVFI